MAEVEEISNNSTGIKLFGTTIWLKHRSQPQNEEERINGHDDDDEEKRPPEKIIPCPRCKSMDTKFCYFNNYNVNQPRHFCKACHRYWTAGGALRNVPVGAGRRKNKPPLTDGCMFDASAAAAFAHLFPPKRRRCGSNSESC